MDSIQTNLDDILNSPIEQGVTTGLQCLDAAMKGLQPGHLITLAASSSMGKSSMMRNMILAAATEVPVGCFPIEGGRTENVEVMLYTLARVNYHKKGNLDYDEEQDLEDAKKKIKLLKPIFFDENADTMYPDWILSKGSKKNSIEQSMETMYNEGVRTFFIDYLQLIGWGAKFESETLRLKSITGKLARLAIRYNSPIVILSQLKKGVEDRAIYDQDPTPTKSDIRDGGFIINDSHEIIMLHRPESFNRQKELDLLANCSENAKIIIAKSRYGPTGSMDVVFKPYCMEWSDSDDVPF